MVGTRLLFFLVFLTFAAPAAADEPGITYDPGSPAGKEYALPLNSARSGGGTGGGGASTGSSGAVPLFGAGVKPVAAAAAKPAGTGAGGSGSAKKRKASRRKPSHSPVGTTGSSQRHRLLPALSPGRPASDASKVVGAGTVAGLAAALALAMGLGFRRIRVRGG